MAAVAQPSPAASSRTVSGRGLSTGGGTPLLLAGGDACATGKLLRYGHE